MPQKYRTYFGLRPATVSHRLRFSLILLLCCCCCCFEKANSSYQPDCVEVICPLEENGTALRLLDKGELEESEKCERCEQCTQNGYSVCSLPVHLNVSPSATSPNLLGCQCAHSGPNVRIVNEKTASKASDKSVFPFECRHPVARGRSTKSTLKPNFGEGTFKLCFSSAIRKLPKPTAKYNFTKSEKVPDLLVTIDQFWLSDYWKALKPSELRLFYLFPVTRKEQCGEESQLIVPNINQLLWINAGKSKEEVAKQKSGIWLCRSSLPISLSESDEAYTTAEEDTPPEVLFEHDVFDGAEKVQLYYEITVQRENQLKTSTGKVKFETRKTKLESEPLDFDLGKSSIHRYQQQMNINMDNKHKQDKTNSMENEKDGQHVPRQRKGPFDGRRTPQGTEPLGQQRLLPEASTAVPAPPGSVPTFQSLETEHRQSSEVHTSSPSILRTPSMSSGESNDRTEKRPIGAEQSEEMTEEEWQLLRNVLLVSLLTIAVLFAVALCFKKKLCCFGPSSQGERNSKTRNLNGKQYRETGQRLK